jgi:hypothetical protein
MVVQAMASVLANQGLKPEHTDITARIRQSINQGCADIANGIVNADAAAKRNAKFLKRLKVKDGAPDLVGDLLRSQLVEIARVKAENERRLRVAHRALKLVDAYTYKTDGPDMERAWQEAAGSLGYPTDGSPRFVRW